MIVSMFLSASAAAQSYNAGLAKYERGDFKGAERALLMAVTKETTKDVKSNTLKLLGICQYMLGNKSGAARSFKDALTMDSNQSIDPADVLDPAVVEYFNRIKKDVLKQEAANKPAPKAAPKNEAPAAPAAPAAPVAAVPGAAATVAAAASAAAATTAGATEAATAPAAAAKGAKKPGTYIIVQADVPDANVMIDGILAGNTGTQIEVDPGLLMIEVNAAGYEPKFQKITAVQGQVSNITIELTKPKKPKKIAKKKARKPRKSAKRKQRNNDDMFGEQQGGPQRAGYDSAADFERDTFNGYQATPPPQAGYPGYGYNQPYEQPYTAPPVAMNEPGYNDRYEARATDNNNYFIAVLPFGAGQFQNRNVAGGILFFAAEAGSLAFYLLQDKEAKTTEDELILYKQQKEAEEEELSEEDLAYIKDTEDYIAKTRQKSKYGIYGFGLLWVAGAVEAIINDPVAKASKQRRRYVRPGYGMKSDSNPVLPPEERYYKAEWQVRLLPEAGHREESLKLQWDLRF